MQTSSKFTMSVHLLACVHVFQDRRMTSDLIASSIGTNPVVVRKLLQKLKAAGLVEVARGTGGVSIVRPIEEISLLEVFNAVEGSAGQLFRFHENPNDACPVGRSIHQAMDDKLDRVQRAFEDELGAIALSDVVADIPLVDEGKARRG